MNKKAIQIMDCHDFDGAYYTHQAVKMFDSIASAIESAMDCSFSLGQSDLVILRGIDSLAAAEAAIGEYWRKEEEYSGSFPTPSIQIDATTVTYVTCSGTNSLEISELVDGYKAVYEVASSKPLEKSTAIKSFFDAGWECESVSIPFVDLVSADGIPNEHWGTYFSVSGSDAEIEKLKNVGGFVTPTFRPKNGYDGRNGRCIPKPFQQMLEEMGVAVELTALTPICGENRTKGYEYSQKGGVIVAMSSGSSMWGTGGWEFNGQVSIVETRSQQLSWTENLRMVPAQEILVREDEDEIYGMLPIRESFHRNLSSSRY